jgi:hypothetical protein
MALMHALHVTAITQAHDVELRTTYRRPFALHVSAFCDKVEYVLSAGLCRLSAFGSVAWLLQMKRKKMRANGVGSLLSQNTIRLLSKD